VDYNGLLVKFQRRFANNFSFLNSYTWGKAIDINSDNDGDVSFTNVYDIENYHRGPADYDVTHTLSSSWIYELPWARDRWYGGWQGNGILYLRTGLPFTVTQTQGVLSTGTGNRPNRICSGKLDNPTIDRWFDTSCFVPPADTTGTYGDSGRNILRGPGQFNIDASLIKNTRIGRFRPRSGSRRSTCSTTRSSPRARTARSATRRSGRSPRCSPTRRAPSAARRSGRSSWG
jgi:hypothetical protein